jgi:glycosyltransferase involved in cell wall biosynthesis
MKILFFMRDTLPPFRPDVAVLFGTYLPIEGISCDIVGQCDPAHHGHVEWPTGKAYCVGKHKQGMHAELLRPFCDFWAMLTYPGHFDLLQVRDKIRTAVFAIFIARLRNKPLVYWMSFPFVEGFAATAQSRGHASSLVKAADQLRVGLSRWMFYRIVLPQVDHIFVQSDAMLSWLAQKGVAANHMTAVPMGVDTERLNRPAISPADDPCLAGKRVIVYVGVLGRARNSGFLLDLLIALRTTEPSIFLVLAGDAASEDERCWIRDQITQRGLNDSILLTGWLTQEATLRYAVRAEVGLSPIPRGELFDVSSPTKLIEYLAIGLPCVANDIPDQRVVIEQSGAGLCVPMDILSFKTAVFALLDDEKLRKKCSELGPPYAREHRDYRVLAKRVAQTYQAILAAYE